MDSKPCNGQSKPRVFQNLIKNNQSAFYYVRPNSLPYTNNYKTVLEEVELAMQSFSMRVFAIFEDDD